MLPLTNSASTVPHSISFLTSGISTLAATSVASTPNIVIDQYPTILRVVSYEDMNTEAQTSPIPVLTRTPSQSGLYIHQFMY